MPKDNNGDSVDEVTNGLSARRLKVVFENRPLKYCFGVNNYGEVIGTFNAADGDPFDVFAPGYRRRLPFDKPYMCKRVIGVFALENQNDKIAVELFVPGYDPDLAKTDIARYCQRYSRFTRKRGEWYSLQEFQERMGG